MFETYIFSNLAFDLEDVLGTWNVLVEGVGDGTVTCTTTSSTVKCSDFSKYGILKFKRIIEKKVVHTGKISKGGF